MARTLKNEEFLILQEYVDASDRIGYYTQLSAWGYVYGDLALGVVNNDSIAGKAANIYLQGYGGEGHKPSNDELAQIGLDLMKADLAARQEYPGSVQGQDLTYDIVQGYHNSVFEANHVDVNAWTPNKALNWLDDPAQKQALWNSFLTDGPILSFASIVAALLDVDQPDKYQYWLDLTNVGNGAFVSPSNEFGEYSISIPGGGLLVGTGARNQDLAVGSDQHDVLISFMGNDELRGGEGNDRLYGQDGNDRLIGGGGDDVLAAGSGDDVVYTGYDDEGTVPNHYDTSDDLVFSGDGNDVVYTTGGSDTISLGDGDDEIHITRADLEDASGAPVDALIGTKAHAVIWGGDGVDSFYFSKAAHVLSVTVDNMSDDLLKNMSVDALFYHFNKNREYPYDYVLINVEKQDKIFLDGTQLTGATIQTKLINHGEFNQLFDYAQTGVVNGYTHFDATSISDWIIDDYRRTFEMSGSGREVHLSYDGNVASIGLSHGSGYHFFIGGFTDGLAGITVTGNADDSYITTTQSQIAIAVKSVDHVDYYSDGKSYSIPRQYDMVGDPVVTTTTEKSDWLLKPDGYDNATTPTLSLDPFQFVDVEGTGANDNFAGSSSPQRFYGGVGNDTVDYSSSPDGIWVDLNQGGLGSDAVGDKYNSIENIIGTAFNDRLIGSTTGNILTANDGDDYLDGLGGNDTLIGGKGSDTYAYSQGYGDIVIIDASGNGGYDVDILVFRDINSDAISIVRYENNAKIIISESAPGADDGGSILIKNVFDTNSDDGIEQIFFADRTILTKNDLLAHSVPSDTSNAATFVGTAGDDHITGTAGNDIIDGLGGNDYVNGGEGSDTYLYSVNDGDEYIDDEAGSMSDVDVLTMKDINYSDVTFSRDNSTSNLLLTVNSTKHVIILDEQYYSSSEGRGLEKVQFADGITVDLQHSDTVWTYHGSNGDDHIVSAIWGKEDVFVGGKGNDYLNGQAGSDTYVYSKGDGSDVISEDVGFTIEEGNTDVLRFTDLNQSDLTFARDGEKLIVAVNGTQDKITVERQFTSTVQDFGVEKIEFADGSSWGLADIWQNIPITGTSANDTLQGSKYNETLVGGHGNDSLNGGAGNDTYIYARGDGSDAITEAAGNGNAEKLVLSGINQADVSIVRDGNNVTLLISESASGAGDGGSILIKDTLDSNSDAGIEQVVFADGTIWTKTDLATHSAPSDTSNAATIVGTAGDDHVDGTAGNDIIDSLGGNDYVNGGEGSDTYLYSVNDGDEYIDDEAGSMTDVDVLKMKDINYGDVTFSRDNSTSNLLLTVNSTNRVITLDEQYYSSSEGWGLEKIQFADGITVDLQHSDTVWTYHGSNGDDHIVGAIWGKSDVFEGGKGNDYLNGEAGGDTYIYSKGDGSDYIDDEAGFTDAGNTDVLRFTDINYSDVSFSRDGSNMIITVVDTNDTITLDEQYYAADQGWGLERIEFADGSSWGLAEIWQNVPIAGTNANDTLQGSKYNEALVGGEGDDTLTGGLGDDYLEGGLGSDTYLFNFGDGHDTIYDRGATGSAESDQLVFGTGIGASDVTVAFGTNNSDLLLTIANGGGEITLKSQLVDNAGGVDQVSFVDGTIWDRSALQTKAAA